MQIQVDTRSPTPNYEQIRSQITSLVLTGAMPAGTRLPPIRQLAGHLGLSNGAVARAYKELEREGTVISKGKQGTSVAARPADAPGTESEERDRTKLLAAAATTYATAAHRLGYELSEAQHALDRAMRTATAPPPEPPAARAAPQNQQTR